MHIRMLIKSQSEVHLHTGHSVHFHPSQFTRPSFSIFWGSGSETNVWSWRPVAALVTDKDSAQKLVVQPCSSLVMASAFLSLSDTLSSTRKKGYEQKGSLLQEVSHWHWLALINVNWHQITLKSTFDIPYTGKLLREKTFANFKVLLLFAKVFSVKFGAKDGTSKQSAKVFLWNLIFHHFPKFSPVIASCYMVDSHYPSLLSACNRKEYHGNYINWQIQYRSSLASFLGSSQAV